MTATIDPERRARLGGVAAGLVRQWLRLDEAVVVAGVAAIGRAAVEQSGIELARLEPDAPGGSAALSALDEIAAALDAPEPERVGWFGRRATVPAPKPSLTELAGRIEAERDAALRQVLTLGTDRARLVVADAALDDAVTMTGLVEGLLKSAAREIAGDDPVRAASLRGEIALRLTERQRDLLLQQTVVQQALQTNELVASGQAALIEALERARTLSVGAVRSAIAARRAVREAALAGPARLHGAIDRHG